MSAPATHLAALPLRLAGVGKEYRVYDSPRARLKALLTGRALHRSHWALQDVSLELVVRPMPVTCRIMATDRIRRQDSILNRRLVSHRNPL